MDKKTNVIEWVNAGPDDIIWVYPYEDLRWGTVVIVKEYQVAIFMRDGKIYDILPPGRHVLTTQNLPLLTRAFNLIMGYGETPFKANVVFVQTKQFRGKFGTSTRLKLSPRAVWMTELQCYGEFYFRIKDPVLFLTQIVGAVPRLSTADVTNFIRSFFTEMFMQELSKYTVMDVYSKLEEVSAKVKTGNIYDAFLQRGLELLDTKIGGISLPLLEKAEREGDMYTLSLLAALQKGEEDKVLEITKIVESMRALGKTPGAGLVGALIAVPGMLGPSIYPGYGYPTPPSPPTPPPSQPTQQPPQPQQQQQQPKKSPVEKLRELKQMLDEGLITKEEYEALKKEILQQMKE